MEFLGSLDTSVFYAINHLPHGWVSDGFFSLISGLGDSGFIWFVIGIWLVAKEELKDKRFFLPLGLAGFFSWLFSEFISKSFVARLRPSTILDDAIVVGFPNGYSMPSTHTTLAFALAFVLSYKEPTYRKWFYLLAGLVGFSRIYVGHHYPGDVLAGMILGLGIGIVTIWWYRKFMMHKKVIHTKQRAQRKKKQKAS